MAYLMPVVLLTWMLVIFALFYYHDKTIIVGAAYEAAVVGGERYSEAENVDTEELGSYFQKRIKGKLLFFRGVSVEIQTETEKIIVEAEARRKGLAVAVKQSAAILYPEKEVRKVKMIKDGLEDLTN